ncbi:hypothetical protein [Methylocystis hirsuta]|nr:hypothetical protein [Methylocystis hirsuta]
MGDLNQELVKNGSDNQFVKILETLCALFALLFASQPACALSYTNLIPASISLVDHSGLTTPGGKVCVIGYSVAGGSPSQPAYYLSVDRGTGQWKQVPAGTSRTNPQLVTAYQLGQGIATLTTSPSSRARYINSVRVTFYYIDGALAKAGFACSSITYSIFDTNGDLNTTNSKNQPYPYPSGILEYSAYPSPYPCKTAPCYSQITIDTSNVDNFETLLQFQVRSASKGLALIGNPVDDKTVTFSKVPPAFQTWLQAQKGYVKGGPIAAFAAIGSVAGSSAPSPGNFQSIQSPTDYLTAKCTQYSDNNWYPLIGGNNCVAAGNVAGSLVHYRDPLNSYYDVPVKNFFANAYTAYQRGFRGLVVMGDGVNEKMTGTILYPENSWTVTSNTTSCPFFLNNGDLSQSTKGVALNFAYNGTPTNKRAPTQLVMCNPYNQIKPLPLSTGYPKVTSASGLSAATVCLSQSQYNAIAQLPGFSNPGSPRNFYNIAQAETNWVAIIKGLQKGTLNGSCPTGYYLTATQQTQATDFRQKTCFANTCTPSNPSFTTWVVSNIPWGNLTTPYETPTQMVFAQDGAFSTWGQYYQSNDPQDVNFGFEATTVLKSIMRNIVTAFARGVEVCNNLTMTGIESMPSICKSVAHLSQGAYVSKAAYEASDAWWVNQANWYPAGGAQNYYAQFLHTLQTSANANLFYRQNGFLGTAYASSNQNSPMGMAYGFAYDETPQYLSSVAPAAALATVSSKLDPIPVGLGQPASLVVTVGPH